MSEQATASASTDPVPSRNPQGIPFRVPTRAELIKYIGDYAEAYHQSEQHNGAAAARRAEDLKRATEKMTTALDYLYGRNAALERELHSTSLTLCGNCGGRYHRRDESAAKQHGIGICIASGKPRTDADG